MEDFYAAGKARAIGVSNYCQSSFDCLSQTWKVKPALNQIEVHVGMGPDPRGLISYAKSFGIQSQAYSPLGDGSSELISGSLVTGIGEAHNMSGAQVSMRWLIEHDVPLTTKTSKQSHMQQDLGIFGFSLEDAEASTLDQATSPSGNPSWACSSLGSGVGIPNVTLNNGVGFPMLSLGTWQYDDATAEAAVKLALQTGFNHIDTAHNYNNQAGVGKALSQFDRASYFLTTKVMSVNNDAYAGTMKLLEEDLTLLGLDSVDMMLLHSPARSCSAIQEQWRAMEDFYAAGKARAIGVSNYCQSSFDCLSQTWKVKPALNQIEVHVGMGPDPKSLISYAKSFGIQSQAYSPLGDGSSELISGSLVSGIGEAHNMSGAQVAMRWLIEHGVPLTTKTSKQSHMQQDLDIFGFSLEDAEAATLDQATSPSGNPSWACSSFETIV